MENLMQFAKWILLGVCVLFVIWPLLAGKSHNQDSK